MMKFVFILFVLFGLNAQAQTNWTGDSVKELLNQKPNFHRVYGVHKDLYSTDKLELTRSSDANATFHLYQFDSNGNQIEKSITVNYWELRAYLDQELKRQFKDRRIEKDLTTKYSEFNYYLLLRHLVEGRSPETKPAKTSLSSSQLYDLVAKFKTGKMITKFIAATKPATQQDAFSASSKIAKTAFKSQQLLVLEQELQARTGRN